MPVLEQGTWEKLSAHALGPVLHLQHKPLKPRIKSFSVTVKRPRDLSENRHDYRAQAGRWADPDLYHRLVD